MLFGLAVLIWALGLGFSTTHVCTHYYVAGYIPSKTGDIHTYIKYHIDHAIGEGCLDLLLMTSYVRHKRDGKKVYTYVPSWSNPLANVQWFTNTFWPLFHRLIHTYPLSIDKRELEKPSDEHILFARAICTELTLYNIWGILKRVANTVWTPNERCQ